MEMEVDEPAELKSSSNKAASFSGDERLALPESTEAERRMSGPGALLHSNNDQQHTNSPVLATRNNDPLQSLPREFGSSSPIRRAAGQDAAVAIEVDEEPTPSHAVPVQLTHHAHSWGALRQEQQPVHILRSYSLNDPLVDHKRPSPANSQPSLFGDNSSDGDAGSYSLKTIVVGRDPDKPMGAFLDKPICDKSNHQGSTPELSYAVGAMQGWRVDMEDAHAVHVQLDGNALKDWSFFAVFDGHAGKSVAQHSAHALLRTILHTPGMKQAVQELAEHPGSSSDDLCERIKRAITDGFLLLDETMRNDNSLTESNAMVTEGGSNERSGTTVVAALISPTHYFIANLGDSRALMGRRNDAQAFATIDHKPSLTKEKERIVAAGGNVMIQRVNGSLAVSRALGDFEYKNVSGLAPTQQLVSPEPDVYCVDRHTDRDEFLLLACDGIYDVMDNDDVRAFIRQRLTVTRDLCLIVNQLLDACLSKGSRDNMSVILVVFEEAAPEIDVIAVQHEQNILDTIRKRIKDLLSSSDDVEVERMMRLVGAGSDLVGLPPGTGLHTYRGFVAHTIAELKAEQKSAAASK